MTKNIGVKLAKAISPKPSTIGLLPLIHVARPTPRAATKGTVIVDVVMPPESYAIPTISFGAKVVRMIMKMYPIIINQWIGQPLTIRKTPTEMADPTERATVTRSQNA